MIVILVFAFVSGIVTILSPCILPVLPIVLSGSLGKGRARPFGVISGFVASFATFTLALSALVQALDIPPDALRWVAVGLIMLFGLVLTVPKLSQWFEIASARLARLGMPKNQTSSFDAAAPRIGRAAGFWSGLPVGLSLGLVWTPCVGPIMASVISLALTKHVDGGSVFITLAYTLGTAIPMLAVMLGGRALLNRVPVLKRRAGAIQRGFGVLMIILGLGIGLGWDRSVQAAILQAFPSYGSGLTAIEQLAPVQAALKERSGQGAAVLPGQFAAGVDGSPEDGVLGDYGLAPPLLTQGGWFNTQITGSGSRTAPAGLTMAQLKGKVVMVDFWTYSCVNCVRTLPYLRAWYQAYKDKGLVIIGVHTPEFEFEKQAGNVAAAIHDLGIAWPVVQDNDYVQWNAYGNKYWPAHYFIDAKGHVRYVHFGEGGYAASEKVIQDLLKETGVEPGGLVSKPDASLDAQTAETYLGYERGKNFVSTPPPQADTILDYRPSKTPGNGEWSLSGSWAVTGQYVQPDATGTLELGFMAKNVYVVIEPQEKGGIVKVKIDGKDAPDSPDVQAGILRPEASRLYQVVKLPVAKAHLLRLEVKGRLRLFAFTFG